MSVEEIVKAVHADTELVEEVLNFIQTFDPSGVGARNLRECLIIQLAAKGLLTDEIEYIIENMLEDLADNRIAHIAKTLGKKSGSSTNRGFDPYAGAEARQIVFLW